MTSTGDMATGFQDRVTAASTGLHRVLTRRHWDDRALVGPDPGIRFNARIGRFVKSYFWFLPWRDDLTYQQAQAYWVFSNWQLFTITGDAMFAEIATAASEEIRRSQGSDGSWPYPNPEWKGRIATVEGCFAALAMLRTYRETRSEALLLGAQDWYRFMKSEVGFSPMTEPGEVSVNYFANWDRAVPNNNTLALWLVAELAEASGESEYLEYAPGMVKWLNRVQLPTGELPYLVGTGGKPDRDHFLCHQYNAFEFVDLIHYRRLTGDQTLNPLLVQLAKYLSTGVTESGWSKYDCDDGHTKVVYYTAALGRALRVATEESLGDYEDLSDRCYQTVLSMQRGNGSFAFHSKGTYGFAIDRRSYPRYLSMILHHLLCEVDDSVSAQ